MRSAVRAHAEVEILDRAASLFARRGFDKTSVQDVATAVGLSKAGLLHHYPSKDALRAAVLDHALSLGQQVLDQVSRLPHGPERDRCAVEVLLDVALQHPGTVSMVLAPAAGGAGAEADTSGPGAAVLAAFGVDADPEAWAGADTERVVRVIGALAALALLTVSAHETGASSAWRPFVVSTCLGALGHAGVALDAGPTTPQPEPDVAAAAGPSTTRKA